MDRSNVRDLLRVPKFTQWAFGIIDTSTRNDATPALWNALHSDIFVCHGCDEINASIECMYKAYLMANDDTI